MALLGKPSSAAACVLLICLLAKAPQSCNGALNIGVDAADNMVTKLRESIFIETKYLEQRHHESCSSLDGPRCFSMMTGQKGTSTDWSRHWDVPGVIPEQLLSDLGVGTSGPAFSTPDFNTLHHFYQQYEAAAIRTSSPRLLAGTDDALGFQAARGAAQRGILHFADTSLDSRLPLSFSRGLPSQVVATWDGRWIARDCGCGGSLGDRSALPGLGAQPLALPAPPSAEENMPDPHAPVLAGRDPEEGSQFVSTVAELTGSVGYLRFSRPVIVRSLFARWQPTAAAVPAILGGRLGLDVIWTTHLDPTHARNQGWQDLGGDPLRPVDEIAFLAAAGLEIGGVEVVAYGQTGSLADERSVLLLAPAAAEAATDAAAQPQFTLKVAELGPAAAPFVVSLQEAVQRNLRLRVQPLSTSSLEASRAIVHGAGALEPEAGEAEQREVVQNLVSSANLAMFDHRYLAHHQLPQLLGGSFTPTSKRQEAFANAISKPPHSIPRDLQRALLLHRDSIAEAVDGYLAGGGSWPRNTPSTLPQNGSDEALARYVTAKQWQAKFDLVTAAFLHAAHSHLQRQAQAALAKGLSYM